MYTSKEFNYFTFAFYNLENLFDTVNNPNTLDDDFTPESEKGWNQEKYADKLQKLARVISQIGYEEINHPPVLTGVAEVENKKVLEDLTNTGFLKNKDYGFVHFNSPDERGIDTALLYRKKYISVAESKVFPLMIDNLDGNRDYTRDILYVKLRLQKQTLHLLVNHWPSRRDGAEKTSYKREAAARKNIEIISAILNKDSQAKIVVMGDFNDDPKSKSVQLLSKDLLYNPMELLLTKHEGSLNYHGEWNLFDQIMFSTNFLQQHGNVFRFEDAKIFDKKLVQKYSGKYKGNPFRTYVGNKYLGGYSDHFPVYGIFSIKKDEQ